MTIKISELANLTAAQGNTIVPVVSNIAGTLTTVKGNLTQIGTYINQAEIPYGNIIPAADAVYSLGTASYRFKDLYLLGSTIYLGNANISLSNNSIQTSVPITASAVNTGNLTVTGNVNASNLAVTGAITVTDITTTGTVVAAELTTTGNVINVGSATLDVTSGALQSSVPIEGNLTSTANLTMQGTRIEFSQGAYIVEEEVFGSPGEFALTLTSAEDGIVGLNAMDANANIVSSVVVSNVAVQLNVANVDPGTGNVNVWYYDNNGGVIFPDGTRQDTAYDLTTAYGNVQTQSYLTSQNITSYSNVQTQSYLTSQNITSYSNVQTQSYLTSGFTGDISGNVLMTGAFGFSNVYIPTAANSVGSAGQVTWDGNYLYICVATDTWKRANIATW